MSNFSILGKTKKAKIANLLGLVIIGILLLSKTNIMNSSVNQGFEYEIPANMLNVSTKEEAMSALNGYSISEPEFSQAIVDAGLTTEEFKQSVKMDFVFNNNQNGFQGLIIEYKSKIDRNKLKPIYDFIAEDVKNYIANKHKS